MNYFEILNSVNVNDKTETKNGLTYLSWAWAWGELKKRYPESYYTIYEAENGNNYFTDGNTCWVKTGVTVVSGDTKIEHIEYLPIMDIRNKSLPLESTTSMDVNKAIQRSLTKAVARHGLGLYIYAGEDLPEGEETPKQKKVTPVLGSAQEYAPKCANCGKEISEKVHDYSVKGFGKPLCYDCQKAAR